MERYENETMDETVPPAERPSIKIIYANTYRIDLPDDHSYPLTLEVVLRPPGFMPVAFAFIHGGSERAVVLGMSVEALMDWAYKSDNLPRHPRLIRITITDRSGHVVRSKRYDEPWLPIYSDQSVAERLRDNLLPSGCPLFGTSEG